MPAGTKKYCEVCANLGRQSRLKLYQINFDEAIQLCENKACSFPLEASSQSTHIQKRELLRVPPLRRKSNSTRSVKSAFSTPFGTPTVLSPLTVGTQYTPVTPSSRREGQFSFNSRIDFTSIPAVNGESEQLGNGNIEEPDLEALLNSGAFDDQSKPDKIVVNSFKEPLPLKPQNPPVESLFSDFKDLNKKYVAKSPRSLPRSTLDDVLLGFDENTNVFPFDNDSVCDYSLIERTDFSDLTKDIFPDLTKDSKSSLNLIEEKDFLKSNRSDKIDFCSADSESALDAEVRSIFESKEQLFEKNNLWSSIPKDKMMAPIKDSESEKSMDQTSNNVSNTEESVNTGMDVESNETAGGPESESCSSLTDSTLHSVDASMNDTNSHNQEVIANTIADNTLVAEVSHNTVQTTDNTGMSNVTDNTVVADYDGNASESDVADKSETVVSDNTIVADVADGTAATEGTNVSTLVDSPNTAVFDDDTRILELMPGDAEPEVEESMDFKETEAVGTSQQNTQHELQGEMAPSQEHPIVEEAVSAEALSSNLSDVNEDKIGVASSNLPQEIQEHTGTQDGDVVPSESQQVESLQESDTYNQNNLAADEIVQNFETDNEQPASEIQVIPNEEHVQGCVGVVAQESIEPESTEVVQPESQVVNSSEANVDSLDIQQHIQYEQTIPETDASIEQTNPEIDPSHEQANSDIPSTLEQANAEIIPSHEQAVESDLTEQVVVNTGEQYYATEDGQYILTSAQTFMSPGGTLYVNSEATTEELIEQQMETVVQPSDMDGQYSSEAVTVPVDAVADNIVTENVCYETSNEPNNIASSSNLIESQDVSFPQPLAIPATDVAQQSYDYTQQPDLNTNDAQPFQTIENVPILEQEIQTGGVVSEEYVAEEEVMQPDQSNGVNLGNPMEGVVVSLPESAIIPGEDSQSHTLRVTAQSDLLSMASSVAAIPQMDDTLLSSSATGPQIAATPQPNIVLQTSGPNGDGTKYTLVTQKTIPVSTQGALASNVAPIVKEGPILISDSSISLQEPAAVDSNNSLNIPSMTASGSLSVANSVKDSSSVTSSSPELTNALLELEADSGPIPLLDKKCLNQFVQWQNRDAMCWLDVVLILLCNSPTIQKLFTDDANIEALNTSVLYVLLKAYYQAQTLLQNLTGKVHKDYKESVAAAQQAAAESNSTTDSTVAGNVPNGGTVSGSSVQTDQPAKPKTTVVNKISVKSMQDYFKAMDILDAVREKIWGVIQPRLQCERGKNDSPLFALPLLVREPAVLKEKFKIKFKYTFTCDACNYHQEDDHSKILPSFPEVPKDFNMAQPSFVRNCFQCQAPGKRMKMSFTSIPDMLLLHFKEGIPHSRLDELCFTFGGETYMVTAVIQYKNNPDHFVAWIRNGTGDYWMECDDLKSTLCQFTPQKPAIPPSQIHIVMWEKLVNADSGRELEESQACNIVQSCLRVLQPEVIPGTSLVVPSKENLAVRKETSQNTVKYILSQSPGTKLPGIVTMPAGTNPTNLQSMKIVSLPPASSASGLLANVASVSAPSQVRTGSLSSAVKPVILQSKTRPTILSSMVTFPKTGTSYQQIAPAQVSPAVSQVKATTAFKVVKAGNKIMYIPTEDMETKAATQSILDGTADGQPTVSGLVAGTSSPNLKYVIQDKAKFPATSTMTVDGKTIVPAGQLIGGSAKSYVVGSDGILQEVVKDNPQGEAVKQETSAVPSIQNTKIIVRRKNESGEVVQSVVTNLDSGQNSELLKAIESLKNGDTSKGGALLQQLIKDKVVSPGLAGSPSPVIARQGGFSVKSASPMISPITTSTSTGLSEARYVKVGDKLVQIQSGISPANTEIRMRGRGRGRGQARGGRKKRETFLGGPKSVFSPVTATSGQANTTGSDPMRVIISPQTAGKTITVGSDGKPVPQVVKIMSSSSASTSIMNPSSVIGQTTIAPARTASPEKKVTTLLASHLAQGGMLKKNIVTTGVSPTAMKVVSIQTPEKSSPVKFVLPSPTPTSPSKSPASIIMKTPSGKLITSLSQSPSQLTTSAVGQGQSISVVTSKGSMSPVKVMQVPTSPTVSFVSSPSLQSTPSLQPVTSLISGGQVVKGRPASSATPTVSIVPKSIPEAGLSPPYSASSSDVEIVSDSEGSRAGPKSPKPNPVISVQAARGDAALLAKAIQSLVDKGVPIQQIQNQNFLNQLIAGLKKKAAEAAQSSTSTPASSLQTEQAKPETQTPKTIVISRSGAETGEPQTQSTVALGPGESPKSVKVDASPGKTPVKAGQSYLEAVKPFLNLEDKIEPQPVKFDVYKSKSETRQSEAVKEAGFSSIDKKSALKANAKQTTSTAIVTPVPIVSKTNAVKTTTIVEEPIKALVLPPKTESTKSLAQSESLSTEDTVKEDSSTNTDVTEKPGKSPPKTVKVTQVKTVKVTPGKLTKTSPSKAGKSEIIVIEESPPGRGKKVNPLHVIADAALSRLPVNEPKEAVTPRARGRPPKSLHIKATPSPQSAEKSTGKKRSFMDAFTHVKSTEKVEKTKKVVEGEKVDEHNQKDEKALESHEDEDSKTNTQEVSHKPKGRPRKQTLLASPVTPDVETKQTVTPDYKARRGRPPRKQSQDGDDDVVVLEPAEAKKVRVTVLEPAEAKKARVASPANPVAGKGRGRGRPPKSSKSPGARTATPESKTQTKSPAVTKKVEKVTPKVKPTETPKGRGRPPTVTPKGRGRPPGRPPGKSPAPPTKSPVTVKPTKAVTPAKEAKEEMMSPVKDESNLNTMPDFSSPDVKIVGKYKILPIERPNTRRKKKRTYSQDEFSEDEEEEEEITSPRSQSPAVTPGAKSGKKRGRTPTNPAKRSKP